MTSGDAQTPAERARTLPRLSDRGASFWTSGRRGELRVGWCGACARHLHPSLEVCPGCQAPAEDVAVSGEAIVLAATVNWQDWPAAPAPPYTVAIVALREDPSLRLTTNVVGCDPGDVSIGMPVRAVFEQAEDVWIPLFEPDRDRELEPVEVDPPRVRVRPPATADRFEHRVALSGIGRSQFGRRLQRTPLELTVESCLDAVRDAGLELADIDGIAAYPGSDGMPGVSSGGVRQLQQALGLQPTWHNGAQETPGQLGGVISAMLAVAAGLCRHVLCFSTGFAAPPRTDAVADGRIGGELAWRVPYGAMSPANWIALCASQYLERYGADRETLAAVAIAARRHAAHNPEAFFREPLSLDDYLGARLVSTPFGLFDCDVPCQGSVAVVVSDAGAATGLRWPRVRVDAVGTQIAEAQSWDLGTLTHQPNVFGPARHLWSRTALRPADVDVALLYDGFTFNVITWLEALGFCGVGEAPTFVAGGMRISLGGEIPVNPHGGQLTAGRSNGFGNLHEAVMQLRGTAGARQVRDAEVAVVSSGGGIPAGCLLLTTDR